MGPIFSHADNYDLYIASLNGTKSTHAMVSEFTQHPAPGTIMTGNIGVINLKNLRLKWSEDRSLRLTHQSLQLEHYTGPPKLKPPALPVKILSPEEAHQVAASLTQAKKRDAAWLSQLFFHSNLVDGAGYNAYEDRKSQTTSGATVHGLPVIRTDQPSRFGTQVIHGSPDKKKSCAFT